MTRSIHFEQSNNSLQYFYVALRMVQCEHCQEDFCGTCSEACKTRVVNEIKAAASTAPEKDLVGKISHTDHKPLFVDATSKEEQKEEVNNAIYLTLDDYSAAHSTVAAPLLREIETNTAALLPTGAHMVSGATQGSFLSMLASTSREGRVLEIGTFTGYATACFLEGAAAAGKCLGTNEVGSLDEGGPFVLSLERDREALSIASAHLQAMADFGTGDEGASAASKLRNGTSRGRFKVSSMLCICIILVHI